MDIKPDFSETSLIGEALEVVLRDHIASFRGVYKHQCEGDDQFPPDWTLLATVPQEDSV